MNYFEVSEDGIALGDEVAGHTSVVSEEIVPSGTVELSGIGKSDAAVMAASAPSNDYWCEPNSRCTSITSDYKAKAKGNVVYGNSDGVSGSFDIVIHTNLNGRQSQAQVQLYKDSGPSLTFTNLKVDCQHVGNGWGCGAHYADNQDGQVRLSSKAWNGPIVYGNKLTEKGTYYDLVTGRVRPDGGPVLAMPSLAGVKFVCPTGSGNCEFD
ncbi:hypothetical protein Q9S36_17775 [Microbacterium sp. ARD31]|uniref:hypothetical protein n=1 Tax=Microbacterium sp. ARD31 TaxID=2962576 RepID=UPI002881BC5A|nr:hypothetical protein [Microbacterium sp. ARD31]MDT0182032.1 hypothetical protein [Microbacterium sp. ARD31]